jgi:hypothetical protein
MQKWLLKPGGVNRVLHSVAALRDLYLRAKKKKADFQRAYRCLRDRMKYMCNAGYRSLGGTAGTRDNRSSLQDPVHATLEAERHALETAGSADDLERACATAERSVGGRLRARAEPH